MYEHTALPDSISNNSVEPIGLTGKDPRINVAGNPNDPNALAVAAAENASFLSKTFETKPHFHEWFVPPPHPPAHHHHHHHHHTYHTCVSSAHRTRHRATVTPGMLCVSRKERNTTFRNLLAAETATPVVACAACLGADDMRNFFFAGVARSKSVRPVDDGAGPQIDEVRGVSWGLSGLAWLICALPSSQYFTLAIGGMVSVLNNSGSPVYPGDCLVRVCLACHPVSPRAWDASEHGCACACAQEWTFSPTGITSKPSSKNARGNGAPRRVAIKVSTQFSERAIGRAVRCPTHAPHAHAPHASHVPRAHTHTRTFHAHAVHPQLSFGKNGEVIDVLLKSA